MRIKQNDYKKCPSKSQHTRSQSLSTFPTLHLIKQAFRFLNPPCEKPLHHKEGQIRRPEQHLKAKMLKQHPARKISKNKQRSQITLPALVEQNYQIRKNPILTQYQQINQFKQKKSFSLNYDVVDKQSKIQQKQNISESQKIIDKLREQKIKIAQKKQTSIVSREDILAKYCKFEKKRSLKLVSHRSKKEDQLIFYDYKGQKQIINQSPPHKINKGIIDMKKSVGIINTQNLTSPSRDKQILKDINKFPCAIQQASNIFSGQKNNFNMQQQLDIQIRNKIQSVSPSKISFVQPRK